VHLSDRSHNVRATYLSQRLRDAAPLVAAAVLTGLGRPRVVNPRHPSYGGGRAETVPFPLRLGLAVCNRRVV